MTMLRVFSFAAAAMLVSCGGAPSWIAEPAGWAQVADGASWISPDAASRSLLYVTNQTYVSVYAYPRNRLIGTLKGFGNAFGACVDPKGNVFVTNQQPVRIYEYQHGATKRFAELKTHVAPVGCAIDPVTGDLAVSGGAPTSAGVDIFKGAQGKARFYKAPQFYVTQFCGYDGSGNLFVDGLKDAKGDPEFAELSKGTRQFVSIKLDAVIDGSGGVQWDGKHIAVGGYVPPKGSQATPVIFRFAIKGTRGKKAGTTMLGAPAYYTSFQFFITSGTAIVPNWYYPNGKPKYDVLFYKYPTGGAPKKTLSKDVSAPHGVVLSI